MELVASGTVLGMAVAFPAIREVPLRRWRLFAHPNLVVAFGASAWRRTGGTEWFIVPSVAGDHRTTQVPVSAPH